MDTETQKNVEMTDNNNTTTTTTDTPTIEVDNEDTIDKTTTTTTTSSSRPFNIEDELSNDIDNRDREGGVDEDDYVLHEIPVYLSQSLSDNLYLFQYPLRQPWRPYDMSKLEELRIKPKQQRVEMDLTIDTDTDNYNPDSQSKTSKYTLSSTTVSHRTNYAIGLMKNNQLHLTPLQSIIQLRPQFNHFDDKWQEEKLRKKQESKDDDDQENEDQANKPPQLQFRKPGAKMAAAALANAQQNMLNEEPWIKVNLVEDVFDQDLMDQFNKLQCDNPHIDIQYDLNESEYFDMLCPRVPDEWVSKKLYIQETVSLEDIHKMGLDLQVKTIMTNGHVVPFSKINQLVKLSVKSSGNINNNNNNNSNHIVMDDDIIKALEIYAVLIRGRWVVKSEYVTNDTDLEIGRNYLLLKFFESDQGIDKTTFCQETGISLADGRELLVKIADLDNKSRVWYLKKQSDDEFLSRYGQVENKYFDYFTGTERDNILDKVKGLTDPNRHSIFGFQKIPADFNEGQSVEHQLLFALYNLFKKHGVCSIESIKQYISITRNKTFANNLLIQVTDKMIEDQLKKMSTIVRCCYVLKSVGDPKVDKYRDIIIDAFNRTAGLKKEEAINLIREKMDTNYVEVPHFILMKILNELADAKGKTWVFKAGK